MGFCSFALWVLLAWGLLGRAEAQTADPLAAAEEHFQAVEFDAARDAAHAAVRTGKLEPEQLTRAYEIIGVSAAAVGNQEEARAAYLRLLALKIDAPASDILPPEKNRVFYEAQGFWFARSDRFDLRVWEAPDRRVEVTVRDPLAMAHTLTHGPKDKPAVRESEQLGQVAGPFWLTLAPDVPSELSFELRDAYGNVLVRRELTVKPCCAPSEVAEQALEAEPAKPPPELPPPNRSDTRKALWRSPWLWGAVSVVVVGAAAATTWALVRERDTSLRSDVSVGN
jgi:hypothetical protein